MERSVDLVWSRPLIVTLKLISQNALFILHMHPQGRRHRQRLRCKARSKHCFEDEHILFLIILLRLCHLFRRPRLLDAVQLCQLFEGRINATRGGLDRRSGVPQMILVAVGVWFQIELPAVTEVREQADVLEVCRKMVAVISIVVRARGIDLANTTQAGGDLLTLTPGRSVMLSLWVCRRSRKSL